jgi:nucleoside-diphosphate-sugar epimerase
VTGVPLPEPQRSGGGAPPVALALIEPLLPVAVAGATGFTGRCVVSFLEACRVAPVCLVRPGSDVSKLGPGVTLRQGDLGEDASLDRWLAGCRSLIYVASMGFGHVPAVVAACERTGIGRAVFVSTTAIFTRLPAASKEPRVAAERAVTESALRATIVRPTMIYGAPGDRNVERLLRFVARWPLVPVPGAGRSLVQPVHVDDVAAAIVAAWSNEAAAGRTYDLSGARPMTLDEMIDAAAKACGKRRTKIHLPLAPVATMLGAAEAVGLRPRIRREQVLRLAEDKAFPYDAAARDLGFAPRTFEDGVAWEARLLGLAPR